MSHGADNKGFGYRAVQSEVFCVLTRFEIRSFWSLFTLYRHYSRVRSQSKSISGLLTTSFVVEDLHTCFTLSLWTSEDAVLEFNSKVTAHIAAANTSFRHLRHDAEGPRLWSGQFRLSAISPYNLRWKEIGGKTLGDAAATEGAT